MRRWKEGDIIERGGHKRKILGVCGEVIFTSMANNFLKAAAAYFTQQELEINSWSLQEDCNEHPHLQRYQPQVGDIIKVIDGSYNIDVNTGKERNGIDEVFTNTLIVVSNENCQKFTSASGTTVNLDCLLWSSKHSCLIACASYGRYGPLIRKCTI